MTNKPLDGIMLKMYEMDINQKSPTELLSKCMNPPEEKHVDLTIKILEKIKGKDSTKDKITKLGKGLNSFGLDPQQAKVIIFSTIFGCQEPVISIISAHMALSQWIGFGRPFSNFLNLRMSQKKWSGAYC